MSFFNFDYIINGTPKKRLLNAYEKMKENYTESSAQEYLNTYKNEPLSFLLENSRIIFSEPYFGYNFYKENVIDNNYCSFTKLEEEYEKVQDYLEENGSLMNESQKNMYEELKTSLTTLLEHTKNTRIYANYIKEHVSDKFEELLSNVLYEYVKNDEKNDNDILELFETVENPIAFFTYIPYIIETTNSSSFNNVINVFCERASVPSTYDVNKWKTFVETTICGNKLANDVLYKEAVNNIQNKGSKIIFEYYMNTSLSDKIDELLEEKVKETNVIYNSPVSAINNIFYSIEESCIDEDENNTIKEEINMYKKIAYESSLDILISEFQQCDDTKDIAKGYSIINENLTLENAFEKLNQLTFESKLFTEDSDNDESNDDNKNEEDVSDDDDINSVNVNDDQKEETQGNDIGKKPQAPKPKNLANKIQNKAMDKEAKMQRDQSIRQRKGQDVINAAKAVTNIPKNVVNSINDQIKALDKKDDERRANFMKKPGFRKKAFRNLKLAILYGSAASVKLALVPTVALCRHFSKEKDRRIRNEVIRDIQTEIKVCEEKISDANANNDQQEKYRLIRIKDKLDAELVRVKTNSKYI